MRFRLLGLLLVTAHAAGCADARGRFEAFEERQAQTGATAGAGGQPDESCTPPPPGSVQGPALMALETSMSPGIAILFLGTLETPELSGKTAAQYRYHALDATDRQTKVGDELVVGPFLIEDDGSFDAPVGSATLPGSANAILPGAPITSDLTLHGTICGVARFYCGAVTGSVSAPIQGPASGQFGLTLLDDEETLPAQPRFGCAEDALAPPLE